MFNYYGSKSKIVKLYTPPHYGKIIEPFCSSARYSLEYWEKDILLVDKYDVIIKIWRWLRECSPKDIIGLPDIKKGELISDLSICDEAKIFLGMLAGIGSLRPRNQMSKFALVQMSRKNKLKTIADNLYKIRHWQFRHGSYEEIDNEEVTWFIDPPYQTGGRAYAENKIDYPSLAGWINARRGQVIVCENTSADWMYFSPLKEVRGGNGKYTTEAVLELLNVNKI